MRRIRVSERRDHRCRTGRHRRRGGRDGRIPQPTTNQLLPRKVAAIGFDIECIGWGPADERKRFAPEAVIQRRAIVKEVIDL